MRRYTTRAILAICAIASVGIGAGPMISAARAQARNDLQRAIAIDRYTIAGNSGAARGEVIYYYKCWVCHNDYTRASGSPAPGLKDIFKRPKLVSGQAVNDDTVSQQIKNGSARMPGFGHSLTDPDIADLLSYLRDKCCYQEIHPPANPWYRASASNSIGASQGKNNLKGGPRGVVRVTGGGPLEGVMVQLIGPNGVRTTVTSNQDGQYEFPQLAAGSYTLRLPRPIEYLPYQKDSLQISGAVKLDDMVLERRSDRDEVPATPEVYSQLTDAEMLWNISGTGQEKQTISRMCGEGCHSYQQIFRNRFDEKGWRLMIDRMLHYSGSPLINRGRARGEPEQEELLVK